MHRHHPYGTPYENNGRHGGSGGPGPDRSHRGNRNRGGQSGPGMARNRPNYGAYDNGMSGYEPMPPNDINGYPAYDEPDPYYHQSYGPPAPYPGPAYDHSYGAYEAPPHPENSHSGYRNNGPQHHGRGGGNNPGGKRGRQPQEKLPDHVIEERISRERPCRTLFIRNIKYETPSEDVRAMFEEHGEIKTFFDLISNRGMVFVTFYDLRAAERARDRLQGSQISNRPIDVHYSLPRDDQNSKGGEKDQGVLEVTLRSPSNAPIDEMELRRKLQPFGDLKSIMPADGPDTRLIEFFDMRASEEVHRRLQNTALQDGVVDIRLCWDPNASSNNKPNDYDNEPKRVRGNRGGRNRQPRHASNGNGPPNGLPPRPPADDGYSRRGPLPPDPYERDRRRYDDDYYGDRGYGPPPPAPASYGGPPGYGGPPDRGYGGPLPPPPHVPPVPVNAPPPPVDNRVEQARQVQQLLAQLKQPSSTPPPSASNGFYRQTPPPPAPLPYSLTGTPVPPPPSSGSSTGSVTLPPNLSSLISQAAAAGSGVATPPQQPYGGAPQGGPPLQQLMSYLQPKAP